MKAKESNLKRANRVRIRVSFQHKDKPKDSHVETQEYVLPADSFWNLEAVFAAPPRVK